MARLSILALLTLICTEIDAAAAVRTEWRGEAALSLTAADVEPRSLQAGLRYVPEVTVTAPIGSGRGITALASLDASWRGRIRSMEDAVGEDDLEAYRLWLRVGAGRYEIRLGRQKLSFGPAGLLRPLMWFDSLDPRDPLQITGGVDALLVRYYLLNNANLWLWGIRGRDEIRGWELLPTTDDTAEYGGRLQWPLGGGEAAFSYHHRRADISALAPPAGPSRFDPEVPEDRFALDGKWDVTVGLWFEAVLTRQRHALLDRPYRRLAVAGLDYTFDLGEGLTVLAEHLTLGTCAKPLGRGDDAHFSALSLRYPWGVLDAFGLILFRDWDAEESYSFLEWRRAYDRWSWHLMAFANPAAARPSPLMPEGELLAGHGVRALMVFNH
jgi:hypothetical protein